MVAKIRHFVQTLYRHNPLFKNPPWPDLKLSEYIVENAWLPASVNPAGFQYAAVASLAMDTNIPPIPKARAPTPRLKNSAGWLPSSAIVKHTGSKARTSINPANFLATLQ